MSSPYNPPPPSTSAPGWIVGAAGGFGVVVVLLVLWALNESKEDAIGVGVFLVALGVVFAAGMIGKHRILEMICAVILIAGAVVALWLGLDRQQPVWFLVAAVFLGSSAIVTIKRRFIDPLT